MATVAPRPMVRNPVMDGLRKLEAEEAKKSRKPADAEPPAPAAPPTPKKKPVAKKRAAKKKAKR